MSTTAGSFAAALSARRDSERAVVDVDEPLVKLVIVRLDQDWFAFAGERIEEILADCPVFFLPGCPPALEGVINVRGDIESVLRLRTLLGYPDGAAGRASYILLGTAGGMRSGVRVDAVEEVIDLPQSSLRAPPATIPEHLQPLVTHIVLFRDHSVCLLDLEQIFEAFRRGLP